MDRSIALILLFTLCLSSGDLDGNGIVDFHDLAILADNWLKSGQDAIDSGDQNDVEAAMTIVLTKLEVTDKTLDLGYKIRNGTDHDVWVCDNLGLGARFEVCLLEDAETLMLRRRLDVRPDPGIIWVAIPIGRYIRLGPGEERRESFSLEVPVSPHTIYTPQRAKAEYARRLVMEIGFYNQDLPKLVRSILEVAERLGCGYVGPQDIESDIVRRYFKGSLIKNQFRGTSYFDQYYGTSSDEFETVYTGGNLGEQVLRIAVENLYIPYIEYSQFTTHERENARNVERQKLITKEDSLDAEKVSDPY